MRASDAERDRVAQLLREHADRGRLADGELSDRLAEAEGARTRGQLFSLTADLPERDLAEFVEERAVDRERRGGLALLGHPALVLPWVLWGGVNAVCLAVWLTALLAGGSGYPWFLWVLVPWGAVMLFVTLGVGAIGLLRGRRG
nr:DUF1707 domain-containing protein [Haloactinospora alba]